MSTNGSSPSIDSGRSPTAQDFGGIIIDLNRVTRKEFNDFWRQVTQATADNEDQLTGDFVERVVTHWPFEREISRDGYMGLGVMDMQAVDDALLAAIALIIKKKSESLLTPPANSGVPSPPSPNSEQTPQT